MAAETASSTAAASGTQGNAQLETGRVYAGTITATYMGGKTCDVKVDATSTIVTNCIYAAGGLFSTLLGFKSSYTPTLNTRVVLVFGNPLSYIVTAISGEFPDQAANRITSSPEFFTGDFPHLCPEGGTRNAGHTHPCDFLEGEFEIANGIGVAIQFLTLMAKLSAGDRAKVEVHVLNEMVRIISETFRHHSAFGDFKIYNDGRLNVRWDGTSYEHESYGQKKERDPKLTGKTGAVDFEGVDGILDTGRWRFSQYVGFLGDFIHTFITDPCEGLGKIGELSTEAMRSGKARFHVGNDGSVLVQSVADIAIERVCRIVVPMELKREDDPKGNLAKDLAALETTFLKFWDYGADLKDAYKTCYQLREYARWLSGFHAFARFHQLDKDWKVPTEAETPEPAWSNKETDREGVGIVKYKAVYACIRIMRDGSIVTMDGTGSAVVLSAGNVQVSAARHLTLEAAGDIRMIAGQNIYIGARRNIELAAAVGGLVMKCRTSLRALCEWGSIWFKSDAVDPSTDAPPSAEGPEDPAPVVMEQAIRFETSKGRTAILSAKQMLLETTLGGKEQDDETADILISSKLAHVRIRGNLGIFLLSRAGMLAVKVTQSCVINAQAIMADLKSKEVVVKGQLRLLDSVLDTYMARVKHLFAVSGVFSPKLNETVGGNHVYILPDSTEVQIESDTELLEEDRVATEAANTDVAVLKPPKRDWDCEDQDQYIGTDPKDGLFETLTQQHLRLDLPDDEKAKYGDWTLGTKLESATNTRAASAPFPGPNAQAWTHTGGEALDKPSSKEYSKTDSQTDLQKSAARIKYRKRKT